MWAGTLSLSSSAPVPSTERTGSPVRSVRLWVHSHLRGCGGVLPVLSSLLLGGVSTSGVKGSGTGTRQVLTPVTTVNDS